MTQAPGQNESEELSVVIVGASGSLAATKVYPAFFSLFCRGLLPDRCRIVGFARTHYSDAEFRSSISKLLDCRYTPSHDCRAMKEKFLSKCSYVSGQYGSRDSFLDLYTRLRDLEAGANVNRVFYLAVPPVVFADVAKAVGDTGLVSCESDMPWSRVVVEKPFGRNRKTSDILVEELSRIFTEEQTYRIDHYLGKEVIQNLLVLRFANIVFEPLWNSRYIESVRITWKERDGVGKRGGYFDDVGIIRDVMQNHLLQILALVAMENPDRLVSSEINARKVEALRTIRSVTPDRVALGQYSGGTGEHAMKPYRDEPRVAPGSRTCTYAAAVLELDSPRWRGVPFVLSCGKAMDDRLTEIRIRFKAMPGNLFCNAAECPKSNELVVRVQPGEAVGLDITCKQPGLDFVLKETRLDLTYSSAFDVTIPEAYERLILDVLHGDKSLFIGRNELAASWDVFDDLLDGIDNGEILPESYVSGSSDTRFLDALGQKRALPEGVSLY